MNRLPLHSILTFFAMMQSLPAALEFTLNPAVQSGALGTEVTFAGTLTNTSASDELFLNDIQFNFTGAASSALAPDGNVFFANVPGVLSPGETYTGPIFTVLVNSSAAAADYTGSVKIRGGANIFALDDLELENLQVSSPLVTIAPTSPDAYEFGSVAGVFTISRSGSVNYDLVVNYAVAGSAIGGSRYNSLSGSITLSNGAASAPVNVIPIPNNVAEGSETVILTISSLSGYNIGTPAGGTVTIHDKPIDEWRLENFGNEANLAGIAGDTADPEGDGMVNLVEYALFSDPNLASVSDLPLVSMNGDHLQLKFHRNTAATDIAYIIEGRSDLISGDWAPIMTRAPGADWTANLSGATALESGSGNYVSVTITDPVSTNDVTRRFLRLRLQR